MKMKNFFKPNKQKVGITIVIVMIAALNIFFGEYYWIHWADFFSIFFFWPGEFINSINVSSVYYSSPPAGFPAGSWDPAAQYTYFIPQPVAIPLTVIVMLAYWYLLACIIAWLFSLRKKQSPQNPLAMHT